MTDTEHSTTSSSNEEELNEGAMKFGPFVPINYLVSMSLLWLSYLAIFLWRILICLLAKISSNKLIANKRLSHKKNIMEMEYIQNMNA